MKIIEYFSDDNKELWKNQIAHADWKAAHFLSELLDDGARMESMLGENARLYLLTENDVLLAFSALTKKDCIDAPERFPWIGFVYTYPDFRNRGYSRHLLDFICGEARLLGYEKVWLATDHENLYEHYGFTYLENCVDVFGENDRIYFRKLY